MNTKETTYRGCTIVTARNPEAAGWVARVYYGDREVLLSECGDGLFLASRKAAVEEARRQVDMIKKPR